MENMISDSNIFYLVILTFIMKIKHTKNKKEFKRIKLMFEEMGMKHHNIIIASAKNRCDHIIDWVVSNNKYHFSP